MTQHCWETNIQASNFHFQLCVWLEKHLNPNTQHGISQNFFPRGQNPPKPWSAAPGIWTPDLLKTYRATPHYTKTLCYAWFSILRKAYSLGPFFPRKLSRRVEQGIFCEVCPWYLGVLGLKCFTNQEVFNNMMLAHLVGYNPQSSTGYSTMPNNFEIECVTFQLHVFITQYMNIIYEFHGFSSKSKRWPVPYFFEIWLISHTMTQYSNCFFDFIALQKDGAVQPECIYAHQSQKHAPARQLPRQTQGDSADIQVKGDTHSWPTGNSCQHSGNGN